MYKVRYDVYNLVGSVLGEALEWGLKGCEFETHWGHCVCVLEQNTLSAALSTGSTQEDRIWHHMTEKLLNGI